MTSRHFWTAASSISPSSAVNSERARASLSAASAASGRRDGRCSSTRKSRRRSRYIHHTAGGGGWLWNNSIEPAGRGRSCFRARVRQVFSALDAGLGITIFPENGLPNTLKSLGSAEALPTLPDFEFVLRRSRGCSGAADHLADMIISFFQLSTALRPGSGMQYQEGSHLQRTHLNS